MSDQIKADAVENALGGIKPEPLPPIMIKAGRVRVDGMTFDRDDMRRIDELLNDDKPWQLWEQEDLCKKLQPHGYVDNKGRPTDKLRAFWDSHEGDIWEAYHDSMKQEPGDVD